MPKNIKAIEANNNILAACRT